MRTLPAILASLALLALAAPVEASTPYQSGPGWCGGLAPVASACEAQPVQVGSQVVLGLDAKLVCLVLQPCADGQVTITATATSGTGSATVSCTYTATSKDCTPITVVGFFLVGQEVALSGTATLACVPGTTLHCAGVPAVAEWMVSVS